MSLIHPCRTNMDLSISTALWFASGGAGVVYERQHILDAAAVLQCSAQRHETAPCSAAADAKR